MAALSPVFASSLFLSFAVSLGLAGLFGAYFGKGRSRAVGFLLALVAVLLLGLFSALTWDVVPGLDPVFSPDLVATGLVAVFAALIGAIAAGLFFVASVMRS